MLPVALGEDRGVAVAVGYSDDHDPGVVTVVNTDAARYPAATFDAAPSAAVASPPSWQQYVQCGYKAALLSAVLPPTDDDRRALVAVVHGTVPAGAGLSSSSATIVAAALAVSALRGLPLADNMKALAEATADAERWVGTCGGGMDQAAVCLSRAGAASLIEFGPLVCTPAPLPPGAAFVVVDSLAVSQKAVSADSRCVMKACCCCWRATAARRYHHDQLTTSPLRYNKRVVECRLAAALLGPATARTLRDAAAPGGQGVDEALLERARAAAAAALPPGDLTAAELQALLGADPRSLFEDRPAALRVFALDGVRFSLRARALHVFQEAARVLRFARLAASPSGDLEALGRMMSESHASCRDLFDCSCPELEALVETFRAHGALGARLTGAGWGGCVVALVRAEAAEAVAEAAAASFYGAGPRGAVVVVRAGGAGCSVVGRS